MFPEPKDVKRGQNNIYVTTTGCKAGDSWMAAELYPAVEGVLFGNNVGGVGVKPEHGFAFVAHNYPYI